MKCLPIPKLTNRQEETFWQRIAFLGLDCWLWIGRCSEDGYGEIDLGNNKFLVHRVMYFIHYNIEPGKSLVCHTCDIPNCVQPKHLFLGTSQDNVLDSVGKFRHSSKLLKGEERPNSKLLEKEVLEIRYKILFFSALELARQYNVHVCTIYDVVKRKTWTHI